MTIPGLPVAGAFADWTPAQRAFHRFAVLRNLARPEFQAPEAWAAFYTSLQQNRQAESHRQETCVLTRPPPTRIQCRRDRPWQTLPKAIRVDRRTRWGNEFRVGIDGDAATCVAKFIERYETDRVYRAAVIAELGGAALACWCRPGEPCHGDVLLRWANPR